MQKASQQLNNANYKMVLSAAIYSKNPTSLDSATWFDVLLFGSCFVPYQLLRMGNYTITVRVKVQTFN